MAIATVRSSAASISNRGKGREGRKKGKMLGFAL